MPALCAWMPCFPDQTTAAALAAPGPGDPPGLAQRAAAEAFFSRRGGIMTGALDGVDREPPYPAIKSERQNQDSRTRGEPAPL